MRFINSHFATHFCRHDFFKLKNNDCFIAQRKYVTNDDKWL